MAAAAMIVGPGIAGEDQPKVLAEAQFHKFKNRFLPPIEAYFKGFGIDIAPLTMRKLVDFTYCLVYVQVVGKDDMVALNPKSLRIVETLIQLKMCSSQKEFNEKSMQLRAFFVELFALCRLSQARTEELTQVLSAAQNLAISRQHPLFDAVIAERSVVRSPVMVKVFLDQMQQQLKWSHAVLKESYLLPRAELYLEKIVQKMCAATEPASILRFADLLSIKFENIWEPTAETPVVREAEDKETLKQEPAAVKPKEKKEKKKSAKPYSAAFNGAGKAKLRAMHKQLKPDLVYPAHIKDLGTCFFLNISNHIQYFIALAMQESIFDLTNNLDAYAAKKVSAKEFQRICYMIAKALNNPNPTPKRPDLEQFESADFVPYFKRVIIQESTLLFNELSKNMDRTAVAKLKTTIATFLLEACKAELGNEMFYLSAQFLEFCSTCLTKFEMRNGTVTIIKSDALTKFDFPERLGSLKTDQYQRHAQLKFLFVQLNDNLRTLLRSFKPVNFEHVDYSEEEIDKLFDEEEEKAAAAVGPASLSSLGEAAAASEDWHTEIDLKVEAETKAVKANTVDATANVIEQRSVFGRLKAIFAHMFEQDETIQFDTVRRGKRSLTYHQRMIYDLFHALDLAETSAEMYQAANCPAAARRYFLDVHHFWIFHANERLLSILANHEKVQLKLHYLSTTFDLLRLNGGASLIENLDRETLRFRYPCHVEMVENQQKAAQISSLVADLIQLSVQVLDRLPSNNKAAALKMLSDLQVDYAANVSTFLFDDVPEEQQLKQEAMDKLLATIEQENLGVLLTNGLIHYQAMRVLNIAIETFRSPQHAFLLFSMLQLEGQYAIENLALASLIKDYGIENPLDFMRRQLHRLEFYTNNQVKCVKQLDSKGQKLFLKYNVGKGSENPFEHASQYGQENGLMFHALREWSVVTTVGFAPVSLSGRGRDFNLLLSEITTQGVETVALLEKLKKHFAL